MPRARRESMTCEVLDSALPSTRAQCVTHNCRPNECDLRTDLAEARRLLSQAEAALAMTHTGLQMAALNCDQCTALRAIRAFLSQQVGQAKEER